eukprot:6683687-Pyramimonas_sp.AAC.1
MDWRTRASSLPTLQMGGSARAARTTAAQIRGTTSCIPAGRGGRPKLQGSLCLGFLRAAAAC